MEFAKALYLTYVKNTRNASRIEFYKKRAEGKYMTTWDKMLKDDILSDVSKRIQRYFLFSVDQPRFPRTKMQDWEELSSNLGYSFGYSEGEFEEFLKPRANDRELENPYAHQMYCHHLAGLKRVAELFPELSLLDHYKKFEEEY